MIVVRVHTSGKYGTLDVAVKTLRPGTISTAQFIEGAKIMHQLRHRRVLMLLGVCTRDEPVYVITELMSNGDLLSYLHEDMGRSVKLPTLIDIAAQVSSITVGRGM